MDNAQFPRTGMVVEPPLGFVSQASGIARSNAPSPALANPTDAVAEAAKRVHYGEAQALETAAKALDNAALSLAEDSISEITKAAEELKNLSAQLTAEAIELASQLRAEGDSLLASIQAKTAHVQDASAAIRSRLSPQPTQE